MDGGKLKGSVACVRRRGAALARIDRPLRPGPVAGEALEHCCKRYVQSWSDRYIRCTKTKDYYILNYIQSMTSQNVYTYDYTYQKKYKNMLYNLLYNKITKNVS